MTRYIERLNRVEAIQNNGEYVDEIIPFLREHGISFEYKDSFVEGKYIDVNVTGELTTLNFGEYLVVGGAGIRTMSSEEFVREFEEDDSVGKKNINKRIKNGEQSAKQPHVRIEFDDIRDVPKVWVDGKLIGGVDDKPLVSLKVDWNTDTAAENHKGFDVSYFDMTGGRGKSTGFHEGSVM